MFVWAASFTAIFHIFPEGATTTIKDNDIFIYGVGFMDEILGNYALRIAGVYILSISTLWTRTGDMPRWLTIITFAVALGFIFFCWFGGSGKIYFPGLGIYCEYLYPDFELPPHTKKRQPVGCL
jgi:hypothetical protein